MGDPRKYTCEELEALPIGTIVIVHDEPNTSVWRVFLPGRIEMISHSGTDVKYISTFAVDDIEKRSAHRSPDLTILGVQEFTTYIAKKKKE